MSAIPLKPPHPISATLPSSATAQPDDITIIGNPHPDFTLGLNLGASFKNFDFTAFFHGSFGNDSCNYTKVVTHFRQFFANVDKLQSLNRYIANNGPYGGPAPRISNTTQAQYQPG